METSLIIIIFIYLVYLSVVDHKYKEVSIHYLSLLVITGLILIFISDNYLEKLQWSLSVVGFFVILEIVLTSLNTLKERYFSDNFDESIDYSVIGIGDFYIFFIVAILFNSYSLVLTVFMLNFLLSFIYSIYLNASKKEINQIAMYPTLTLSMIILYFLPFDLIQFLNSLI